MREKAEMRDVIERVRERQRAQRVIERVRRGFHCFRVKFCSMRMLQTTSCKVEFNQPSCWLYSIPNFLVFQQLVTLYLGGIFVRVVSEIV